MMKMRRNIIRISLILVLILLAFFLSVIGKEHKILVDNKDLTTEAMTYTSETAYTVWIDDQEVGTINIGKRKVGKVVGTSHTIVVEDATTGVKIEKTFKLKTKENPLINLPALIAGVEEWIDRNPEN